MRRLRIAGLPWLAGGWVLLAGAVALADTPKTELPIELKLPPEIVYQTSVGKDSAVVFRHETHVALADRKCTGCHPTPFRMLTPVRKVSHREMRAGRSCGICHDGRKAFGVADREACGTCHAGRPQPGAAVASGAGAAPARGLPKPIAYARGDASPGRVTFRHETHAQGGCATCHPKRFAMKSAGAKPGGGMHESAACGGCHDGRKAFAVDDTDACSRCHVEGKGS